MSKTQRSLIIGAVIVIAAATLINLTGPWFINVAPPSPISVSRGAAIGVHPSILQQSEMDIPQGATVQPVDIHLARSRSLFAAIFDDDPTYRIEVDYRIEYPDGSSETLRWASWRYGLLIGSVIMNGGDGPPGTVEMLTANS